MGVGSENPDPLSTPLLSFIQQLLSLQGSLQHAGEQPRPVVQVIWGGLGDWFLSSQG